MKHYMIFLAWTPLRNSQFSRTPSNCIKSTMLLLIILTLYLVCYTQYHTINEYNKQLKSEVKYTACKNSYRTCTNFDSDGFQALFCGPLGYFYVSQVGNHCFKSYKIPRPLLPPTPDAPQI